MIGVGGRVPVEPLPNYLQSRQEREKREGSKTDFGHFDLVHSRDTLLLLSVLALSLLLVCNGIDVTSNISISLVGDFDLVAAATTIHVNFKEPKGDAESVFGLWILGPCSFNYPTFACFSCTLNVH
ncbi:unnamed protein product [Camellia sinensis]